MTTGEPTPHGEPLDPSALASEFLNSKLQTEQALLAAMNTVKALQEALEASQALTAKALGHLAKHEPEVAEALRAHFENIAPASPITGTPHRVNPATTQEKSWLARIAESRPVRVATAVGTLAVAAFATIAISGGNRSVEAQGATTVAKATKPASGHAAAKKAKTATSTITSVTPPKTSYELMMHRAESATTVAVATKEMAVTPATVKENIRSIFSESGHQRLDHNGNSMSSLRSEFKAGHIGALKVAESIAFNVKNSEGYAAKTYNALFGHGKANVLPEGVTHEQALKAIEAKMTADGTHFAIKHPKGTFLNYMQKGETVSLANILDLNGDIATFVMETKDGKKLYVKESNLCDNIMVPTQVSITLPPSTSETPTPIPTPKPPKTTVTHPHHHQPPVVVIKKHPHHPVTPVTPPKHDRSHTPAGVPGENHGTGTHTPTTGPGRGPAGQPRDPNGFLPGENHPATPTPAPTPVPVENQPAPTGPAETGPDGGPSQPATPSTSTGQPGTPNINGTPPQPN